MPKPQIANTYPCCAVYHVDDLAHTTAPVVAWSESGHALVVAPLEDGVTALQFAHLHAPPSAVFEYVHVGAWALTAGETDHPFSCADGQQEQEEDIEATMTGGE